MVFCRQIVDKCRQEKQRDGARNAVPLFLMQFYPVFPRRGLTSRPREVMRQRRTVRLANFATFWRAVTVPHTPYLFAAHFTSTSQPVFFLPDPSLPCRQRFSLALQIIAPGGLIGLRDAGATLCAVALLRSFQFVPAHGANGRRFPYIIFLSSFPPLLPIILRVVSVIPLQPLMPIRLFPRLFGAVWAVHLACRCKNKFSPAHRAASHSFTKYDGQAFFTSALISLFLDFSPFFAALRAIPRTRAAVKSPPALSTGAGRFR